MNIPESVFVFGPLGCAFVISGACLFGLMWLLHRKLQGGGDRRPVPPTGAPLTTVPSSLPLVLPSGPFCDVVPALRARQAAINAAGIQDAADYPQALADYHLRHSFPRKSRA